MAEKRKGDNIHRHRAPSAAGTATWIGIRAADPFLQYGILSGTIGRPILNALHGTFFSQGPSSNYGISAIDNLQLSPYRLALLGMAVGASVKHIFWKVAIHDQYFPPSDAGFIAAANSAANSINSLLFINRFTSPAAGKGEGPNWPGWPSAPLVIGSALFVTGILLEGVSEAQRKAFKSKPENKAKVYTGGLFSLARHINYGGYSLWRSGYALAAGGWLWAGITSAFWLYDFTVRGVPVLDKYCEEKYADLWHDYRRKTPYKLLPYIY